ncbi:hypothetical protein DK871_02685 [Pseudomonas sp. L13]|nr:hypothetical protein [Pseudomonas sp. L13]RFD27021.1 hypothetical protein CER19_19670 [Pseudomonas sp. GL93]
MLQQRVGDPLLKFALLLDVLISVSQITTPITQHVSPDFFDFIIIDEGHHAPADTWRKRTAG